MDIQHNKQVVMEGYQLFQRGDIAGLLERYHESAEWIGPTSEFLPFASSFRGKAGIGRLFALLDAAVKPLRFAPNSSLPKATRSW